MFRGFQRPPTARRVPARRPKLPRPPTISPSIKRMLIATALIVAVIVGLFATSAFWVNWWWYGSIGYRNVLTYRYAAVAMSFIAGGVLAAALFAGNLVMALRRTRASRPAGRFRALADRLLLLLATAATAGVFLMFGLAAASRWDTWVLWLRGGAFGLRDPVFNRDVGFYIFALPALQSLQSGLLVLLILTIAAVAVLYALRLGISIRDVRRVPALMRVHLLALGGAVLLVVAARFLLANYELVYSNRGPVFGASYTDVNVQRWANWLLAAMTLAIAALLVLNAFVRRIRLLLAAVGAWALVSVLLGAIVPAAVQQTVVEPSELQRERPYIANNIAMTRAAYDLEPVSVRVLSGQEPLTEISLSMHQITLSNIRLWDYRVIRTTFQQLQSFVPYYVFRDVDVQRYLVDGQIQQVLLSARELDQEGLPPTAQTWTNRRLVYTHGYGVVVSPVGDVSPQGLPTFLVERIPPTGSGVYRIDRPEIYFGEGPDEWVAVSTEQAEFGGLIAGDAEVLDQQDYRYEGTARGAVRLSNYLTRLLLAAYLQDRNLLLSGALTDESQVLLRRNIVERARAIAPFLMYDPDPYLVIADGRLVWIVDAYTHSNRFPHATRTRGINYLRHSVKVVVDAYDGTTTFYRTAVPDPIADAYDAIFGGIFVPIAEAPPAISAQFRYPELLFDIQSDVYASFHVTDPTAFYNGEDRWAVPVERVGGTPTRMEPYYVTMTLPGEDEPDFILIRPFTPGGRTDRQNMTAWMAGRTDNEGRLSLVLYRFPRQVTVFGPSQIEARIDQEPEISAQITLWSQSGSTVIRGNLLVIPIGESLLYVQPLYLQATGTQGALPELKRVIAASSERVVMRERLDEALQALVSGADVEVTVGPLEPAPAPTEGAETVAELARQALEAYQRAQEALARGDWAAYGEEQATLRALLERLAELTESDASPPQATPALES